MQNKIKRNKSIKNNIKLIIHYNDKTMNYELNDDFDSWNDEIYIKLRNGIKIEFNLPENFTIYDVNNSYIDNQKNNEIILLIE